MKKTVFLVTTFVLLIFTTGCINNLAVQELNNKAAEYTKKGDYENAISRLKSSVDLDPTIFESQYNLAVAYTENEDYEEAKEAFEKALEIRPNSKDVYYSMAVMYENYAKDLFSGNTKAQKDQAESYDENNKPSFSQDGKFKPNEEELENVKECYENSIECYEKYLELAPNSNDAEDVRSHIEDLRTNLQTLDFDTN